MTQTLEQLIERRKQLLEDHPNLKPLQKFLEKLLEEETPEMRCKLLLNMSKHQMTLLQDTMAQIVTDVEEVQRLCSELPLDFFELPSEMQNTTTKP